jgi:hypothetical protein
MKRIQGDLNPEQTENIGGGLWAVRFDIQKQEKGYDYYEKFFAGEPATEDVRPLLIEAIEWYDKSENVNSFLIGVIPMWLDKATRTGLAYTITVEETLGNETTSLWYESEPPVEFTLPVEVMKQMLGAVEVYAKETYNVTQKHKAAVYEIESVEELLQYDFRSGYPDKLEFEL